MKQSSVRAFIAAVLLVAGLQSSAQSPVQLGAVTPNHLNVTLKKAALQQTIRGEFKVLLFDTPSTLDVVDGDNQVGGQFTTTTPRQGKYTGIQLTFDEQGTYSGTDPCTGLTATDAPITLADDGADDLFVTYEQPHPVTGLAAGALPMDPFTLGSDPVDMHLVFPVTNSIVCLSDTPPIQTIRGKQTGLGNPFDVAVDPTGDGYYVVSNAGADRISYYNQATVASATDPNVSPAYIITGPDSQISNPTGLYVDTANDQLYVANAGSDVITVYDRSAITSTANTDGNVPPVRTISGATTLLNTPGDMAYDSLDDDLVVVNGDKNANSVTFYHNPASLDSGVADVTPAYKIVGANTGLGAPCGVYVDDTKVYVTNNAFNSIAVYLKTDVMASSDGNILPSQYIQGPKTGLSAPCGIDVDANRGEIAVASSLNSRILFFNINADGDVYPLRRIQGAQTLVSGPSGLKIDDANNTMTIVNNGGTGGSSLIVRSVDEASPHVLDPPTLINGATQQTIYVKYTFDGTVSRVTGNTESIQPAGYNYVWRIFDDQLRQEGNASNARMIPPENLVLTLADGSQVSNLELGCPVFTPFTLLQLSTNCSLPLIVSPFPAKPAPDYRVIAALFGQKIIQKIPVTLAPLTAQELPVLDLNLTLVPNSAIVSMDWSYKDGTGQPIDSPDLLIESQSISINLTRPFSDVDPCYKQVSGNASSLVFQSSSMGSDPRSLSDVKNNNCDIFLDDVDTITLTATDSLSTRYIYKFKPVTP